MAARLLFEDIDLSKRALIWGHSFFVLHRVGYAFRWALTKLVLCNIGHVGLKLGGREKAWRLDG